MKASIDAAGTGAVAVPARVTAAPSAQRGVQALAVSTAGLLLSIATTISSGIVDIDLDPVHHRAAEQVNVAAVFGTAAAQLFAGLLLLGLVRHLVRGIGPDDDGFRAGDVARAWAIGAAFVVPLFLLPTTTIFAFLPPR